MRVFAERLGMTEEAKSALTRTVPFWAGLTFAAFGAVAGLALSDAINNATTLLLMIVPAALFFQTMRVANRGGSCTGNREAQRRYTKRVALFTSLYLLALAVMTIADKNGVGLQAVRVVLATLPGLAIIGVFWAIGRLIVEERDEFLRMLTIRQSLIATALALSAASVWGFLETADIVVHLDAYWWAVVWFGGIGVGAVMNRMKYGSWGAM